MLALHDGTSGGAAWTIQAHGILLHFFRILLGPVCSVQNPPGQSFVVSEMFPLPKSEATDLPICALPMKLRLSWVHWALEEFVLLWVDIGISEDNLVCHWESFPGLRCDREVFECSALGGRWTPINGALWVQESEPEHNLKHSVQSHVRVCRCGTSLRPVIFPDGNQSPSQLCS